MLIDLLEQLISNMENIIHLIMQLAVVAYFSIDNACFPEEHLRIVLMLNVQPRRIAL